MKFTIKIGRITLAFNGCGKKAYKVICWDKKAKAVNIFGTLLLIAGN